MASERGVQRSLPNNFLDNGGWTCHYDELYKEVTLNSHIESIPHEALRVFVGARGPNGEIVLGAIAERAAVVMRTEKNQPHESNGVWWYFWPDKSFGFAPNRSIDQSIADSKDSEDKERLSWHVSRSSGSGGYRAGANTDLNGSTTYRKLIYYLLACPPAVLALRLASEARDLEALRTALAEVDALPTADRERHADKISAAHTLMERIETELRHVTAIRTAKERPDYVQLRAALAAASALPDPQPSTRTLIADAQAALDAGPARASAWLSRRLGREHAVAVPGHVEALEGALLQALLEASESQSALMSRYQSQGQGERPEPARAVVGELEAGATVLRRAEMAAAQSLREQEAQETTLRERLPQLAEARRRADAQCEAKAEALRLAQQAFEQAEQAKREAHEADDQNTSALATASVATTERRDYHDHIDALSRAVTAVHTTRRTQMEQAEAALRSPGALSRMEPPQREQLFIEIGYYAYFAPLADLNASELQQASEGELRRAVQGTALNTFAHVRTFLLILQSIERGDGLLAEPTAAQPDGSPFTWSVEAVRACLAEQQLNAAATACAAAAINGPVLLSLRPDDIYSAMPQLERAECRRLVTAIGVLREMAGLPALGAQADQLPRPPPQPVANLAQTEQEMALRIQQRLAAPTIERLRSAGSAAELEAAINVATSLMADLPGLLDDHVRQATQRLDAMRLQAQQPAPPQAVTFVTSNFYTEYARYSPGASPRLPPVRTAAAVLGNLDHFVFQYCELFGFISEEQVSSREAFYELISQETARHQAVNMQVLGGVGATAGLLWTSDTDFVGMPAAHRKPFYKLLNAAILHDWAETAPAVAAFARALNSSLVVSRTTVQERFPADGITYRGGGFGLSAGQPSAAELRGFFTQTNPPTKFRVPAFLATSFSEDKARHFIRMATDAAERVLWIVHTDPRGDPTHAEHDDQYRCKHVNFVQRSMIEDSAGNPQEDEYLFAPYSVFSAREAIWRAGTIADPHVIHLEAAPDNEREPLDLPLAPWY